MENPNKRDSFIFYRSFLNAVNELGPEDVKSFILAIGNYALDSVEPNLDGFLGIVWACVKPQLDANIKRYENGKKGGAPKGSRNNPAGRRGKTIEEKPEIAETDPLPTTKSEAVPISPTKEQVVAYFKEINFIGKGEIFFNHYQSRGWFIGSNPIRDWKALAQTWLLREKEQNANAGDSRLGCEERIDESGNRTYGDSGITVPHDAPPRPSKAHWWNTVTQEWDSTF